jgi:sugar/nucleoside kinase (ribokinase family)
VSIWVCGEVLIDLIPDGSGERVPHVGGGPANTAKALARLGHDVTLLMESPVISTGRCPAKNYSMMK